MNPPEPDPKPPVFFRLFATDESPYFDPVGHITGTWYGVGKIEGDEVELARLRKRGAAEISKAEYEDQLKKKAQGQSPSDNFRLVPSSQGVPLAAERAAKPEAEPARPPKVAELSLDSLAKPAPVPQRRRAEIVTP
jgi:hypothetical protein